MRAVETKGGGEICRATGRSRSWCGDRNGRSEQERLRRGRCRQGPMGTVRGRRGAGGWGRRVGESVARRPGCLWGSGAHLGVPPHPVQDGRSSRRHTAASILTLRRTDAPSGERSDSTECGGRIQPDGGPSMTVRARAGAGPSRSEWLRNGATQNGGAVGWIEAVTPVVLLVRVGADTWVLAPGGPMQGWSVRRPGIGGSTPVIDTSHRRRLSECMPEPGLSRTPSCVRDSATAAAGGGQSPARTFPERWTVQISREVRSRTAKQEGSTARARTTHAFAGACEGSAPPERVGRGAEVRAGSYGARVTGVRCTRRGPAALRGADSAATTRCETA